MPIEAGDSETSSVDGGKQQQERRRSSSGGASAPVTTKTNNYTVLEEPLPSTIRPLTTHSVPELTTATTTTIAASRSLPSKINIHSNSGHQIIRNREDVRIVESPLLDSPHSAASPHSLAATSRVNPSIAQQAASTSTTQRASSTGSSSSQQQQSHRLPVKALFPVHTIGNSTQNRITFRRQFIPPKKTSSTSASVTRQSSTEEEGPTVRQHLQQQLASGTAGNYATEGMDSNLAEDRLMSAKSKFSIYSPKAARSRPVGGSISIDNGQSSLLGIARESTKAQPLRKAHGRKRSAPIFAPTSGTHTVSSVPVGGELEPTPEASVQTSMNSSASTSQPRSMASHTMTIVQPGFGPKEQLVFKVNRKLSSSGGESEMQGQGTAGCSSSSVIPRSTNASVQSLPLPLTSIAAADRRAVAAASAPPTRITNGYSAPPSTSTVFQPRRDYPTISAALSAPVRITHPSLLVTDTKHTLQEPLQSSARIPYNSIKDEMQMEKVQRILANSGKQQRRKQNSRSEEGTNEEALQHYFEQLSMAIGQNSLELSTMDAHMLKINTVLAESLMADGEFDCYEEVQMEDHTGELDDDILEKLLQGVPKFDQLLEMYYEILPDESEAARLEAETVTQPQQGQGVPQPKLEPEREKPPEASTSQRGQTVVQQVQKVEASGQNMFNEDLDLDQYLNVLSDKDPMLTEGETSTSITIGMVENMIEGGNPIEDEEKKDDSPSADINLLDWLNQMDDETEEMPDDDELFSNMFKNDGKTLNEFMGDLGDFDAGELEIGPIGGFSEEATGHTALEHGRQQAIQSATGEDRDRYAEGMQGHAHGQKNFDGHHHEAQREEETEDIHGVNDFVGPEYLTFTALDNQENVQQYLKHQCLMLCDDLNRMSEAQRNEHLKLLMVQREDEVEKSYSKKLQVIKKDMKSLVYANAALVDEISRLSHRVNQCNEERKVLARRLCHHFRNYIRRLQTAKRRKQELERKAAELHLKGEAAGTTLDEIRARLMRQEVRMPQLVPPRMAGQTASYAREELELPAIAALKKGEGKKTDADKGKQKKGRKPRQTGKVDNLPLITLKTIIDKKKDGSKKKLSAKKKSEGEAEAVTESVTLSVPTESTLQPTTPTKQPLASPTKRHAVLASNSPVEEGSLQEKPEGSQEKVPKETQAKSRLERAAAREALRKEKEGGEGVKRLNGPSPTASIARETRASSRTTASATSSENQVIDLESEVPITNPAATSTNPTPRKTSERIAKRLGEVIDGPPSKRQRNTDSESPATPDYGHFGEDADYQPKVSKARKRISSSGSDSKPLIPATVRTRSRQRAAPSTLSEEGTESQIHSQSSAEVQRTGIEGEEEGATIEMSEISHAEESEADKKRDKNRRVSQRELLQIHTEEIITVGDAEADNSDTRLTRSKRQVRTRQPPGSTYTGFALQASATTTTQQQSPRESLSRSAKRKQ